MKQKLIYFFILGLFVTFPRYYHCFEINTEAKQTISQSDLTYYYTYSHQHYGASSSEQVLNILPNLFYRQIKTNQKNINAISLRNKNAKHYISVIYKFTLEYIILSLKGVILLFPFHDFY